MNLLFSNGYIYAASLNAYYFKRHAIGVSYNVQMYTFSWQRNKLHHLHIITTDQRTGSLAQNYCCE